MKKITICFAVLLLSVFGSFAQVQLGDGTAIEKGVPFEPRNPYSYAQSIYLSSEILATGQITSIQWYYAGDYNLEGSQELTVYLGHTTKTAFSSGTDWEPIENLTEVYVGEIEADGPGWVTIELQNPFTYNGTDNLIVAAKEDSDENDFYEDQFYAYEVEGNRSITFASWSEAVDVENPEEGMLTNFVANISLDGINQACPKPIEIIAEDITTNGVTLYWTSNAPATQGSQYYFATTNTAPTPTTEPTGSVASGQMAVVEDVLLSGTPYYAWVRDVCEEGPGTWSNAISFVTLCDPISVFYQDFNSTTPGTVPVCWSSVIFNQDGDPTSGEVVVTNEDGVTGNSVQFYTNGDGTSEFFLVSPELSNLAAGTHRLTFFAKDISAIQGSSFIIGTLDDNVGGANFNVIDEINLTNTFKEFKIDFDLAEGTIDTYIGIRLNTTNENFLGYIDNIRWELAPLCPDAENIVVPLATTTTATIAWTADESITEWEVVYSDSATADPATLTPVIEANEEATASIEGLTAETTYYVWVRSKCDDGEGFWVGPTAFTTACPPVNSINENFDEITGQELPYCWSSILRGNSLSLYADVRVIYNDLATSGTSSLELYSGYSNPAPTDDIMAVSPNLGNLSSGTHRLKFFAKGTGTLQIVTLASNTNAAPFQVFEQVELDNDAMTEYVIDFSSYAETNTYIGFRYNTIQMFSGVMIDDVIWEPIPACPDVTDVDAVALDINTIAVGWNASDASQWQTAHGLVSITDPNLATISDILTIASNEIEGLSSNTNYNVWVRTVCGETDGNGAWKGPFLVRTPCEEVSSFNETFEDADAPQLPSCWSSVLSGENIDINGGAGVSVITWQPYAGSKGVEIYNAGSASTDNIILVSPTLNNLTAGTHLLKFYAARLGDVGSLEIGTLDGDGFFTFYEEITLTSSYEEYTVDFGSYSGTDNRIGFRLSSEEGYMPIGMDNISWQSEDLSNGGFEKSNFNFYPNPVKNVLNVSYDQNITKISVYNMLGQLIMEHEINSTTAQIDMQNLSSGSYLVKVNAENQTKSIKILKQ
ncbi:T9SS type A sorting domain-containing protein [Flavobacterium soli]|uniref:T9SS type A sorting domain-containing protein n=1 Tax=Flavobacterium soli TaxID=344881 RepID=UPI00040D7347|nr:T9SS type A sorting domain-containing protein [Flavobacterium soli]